MATTNNNRIGLSRGAIETVLGPIAPQSAGQVLCHEHLYHRATSELFSPRKPADKFSHLIDAPFDVDNLWWINYHPYSNRDNLVFTDVESQEAIREELIFLMENTSIATIVECTTFGTDVNVLKSLSQESNVNIVLGTGYYVNMSVPQSDQSQSVAQLYAKMARDLEQGLGDSGCKAGIIGEIGTCWPIHPFEEKVLKAAAAVSCDSPSVPISIHPGRDKQAPEECLRIILEAGANQDKIVMCHVDRTLLETTDLLQFADSSRCYIEFDLFGTENSYYELSDDLDMPSDANRISRLKALTEEGHLKRLLISHDIHTKQRLMAFGGHGFSHISLNTLPKMKMRGFTDEHIKQIMQYNPVNWLTL